MLFLCADYRQYGLWLFYSVFDVAEYAARVEIAEATFRAGFDALNRRFERTKVNLSRQLDQYQSELPPYSAWLIRDFPSNCFSSFFFLCSKNLFDQASCPICLSARAVFSTPRFERAISWPSKILHPWEPSPSFKEVTLLRDSALTSESMKRFL